MTCTKLVARPHGVQSSVRVPQHQVTKFLNRRSLAHARLTPHTAREAQPQRTSRPQFSAVLVSRGKRRLSHCCHLCVSRAPRSSPAPRTRLRHPGGRSPSQAGTAHKRSHPSPPSTFLSPSHKHADRRVVLSSQLQGLRPGVHETAHARVAQEAREPRVPRHAAEQQPVSLEMLHLRRPRGGAAEVRPRCGRDMLLEVCATLSPSSFR